MSTAPRSLHVVAGVVAGITGIAVSHTLTMLLTVRTSPLLAVAEAIIDVMPGPLVESLVQLTGDYDKPILLAGVALGALGLCAWAGALAEQGQGPAAAVFVGMGLVGAAAVWTRPEARLYDVVPVVAGVLTWIIALRALTRRLAALRRRETVGEGPALARRRFLVEVGVLAFAALAMGTAGQVLGAGRRSVETARRLLRLPVSRGTVPRGAQVDVDGVVPWRTPNPSFYRIDTALVVPAIDPTTWRLRVHGMVDRELDLTYRDLLARELTEDWVTLCCVSNEVGGDLVGNAWWSGVRLADVLAEAGVGPGADAVLQTSEDGWTCATPVEAMTDGRNALLAIAMNGEPLPLEHGFPVRVVVPGLYGYVSATKWVVDLEVTRFADVTAYWTSRGWAPRAPVKTQSRIDVPRPAAEVPAGDLPIGGVAWAQQTGIEQVEYRLDGLPWTEADLGHVVGVDTWVQWAGAVRVAPGSHTLAVRATDRRGSTQTAARTDVLPDGATGWHTVEFTAVSR